MKYISVCALWIAGLIHLIPLQGVLGVGRLQHLYGAAVDDPNIAILLQHRALLFGMLGAFLLCAAHWPALRSPAMAIGLFSASSFIVVALLVGGYNEAISRVVWADVLVCLVLAAGWSTEVFLRASPRP